LGGRSSTPRRRSASHDIINTNAQNGMSNIATEILFILLLILANGVFALSEIAVVSARKARLQEQANRGNESARAALALAQQPSRFLSTVQIGITLVGVLAGAFGGATLAEQLAAGLSAIPGLAPYSEALGIGIVVIAISYLSLVLGELAPKRLALNNPEAYASTVAIPMRVLSRAAAPVVRLLTGSTDLVLRLLRVQPSSEPPVTEEEIKILIEQGRQVGVFEDVEQDIVESVFRMGERRIGALMTPRTEVVWLDATDSLDQIEQQIVASHHSRFPVGLGSLDEVTGVLRGRDLLARRRQGQPADLRRCFSGPCSCPRACTPSRLWSCSSVPASTSPWSLTNSAACRACYLCTT
jgi:putative hemolysin